MRKTFKWKQLWSILVCLSMVCTLIVPSTVSASFVATLNDTATSNGVGMDYEKRIRDNSDGTYTLTIAAQTAVKHTAANTDSKVAKKGYYVVPEDGEYIVQVWGSAGANGANIEPGLFNPNRAQGGKGGTGGYVEGVVTLTAGQVIAYDIGGNGYSSSAAGGGANNGGNHGSDGDYYVGGGGGYTAVYVYDSTEAVTYNHNSNYVLIAGGGGGGGTGYSNQAQTPDGGNAGNMKTSASAQLTEAQNNGVAGTYYVGTNGKTNSGDDRYAGKGATYLPGESNSSVWGWMTSNSGNDWRATYDASRNGGAGGNANGRGGAGGAGFAGGGGGVQSSAINVLSSECGGGGGGSSFIAASVAATTTIDETYTSLMEDENISTTGGSVVIIPVKEGVLDTSALKNASVTGAISEYFTIVSIDGEAYTGSDNSFTVTKDLTLGSSAVCTIIVKPVDGFMGGNAVPVLEEGTSVCVEADGFSYVLAKNNDTDYVNVPWTHKITTNTIYSEPGDTLNTADLYADDNGRENVGTDNYEFISEISEYSVEGINGDTFTAPDETTRYTVSYTVTATKAAAKVGTPVNGTVSAIAVVDVSGLAEVPVDGAKNGYNKTLRYNSETNTYDLVIEHTVSAVEGIGSDVTYNDEITEVGSYTTAGSSTYTIKEDGYYLILLRGANGGQGTDTCARGLGGGHRHGFAGVGAAGSNVAMIGDFSAGDQLTLEIGANASNNDLEYVTSRSVVGNGGDGGGYTAISLNDSYLAIAGGGGGGGGSFATNGFSLFGGNDYFHHGYSATQNTQVEISDSAPNAANSNGKTGVNGEDKGTDGYNSVLFAAGESGKSYVYRDYTIENFEFDNDPLYNGIKETDAFTSIITEVTKASVTRTHSCTVTSDVQPSSVPNDSMENSSTYFAGLAGGSGALETSGIKIYKISRTKTETELPGVREKLNLGGEISKYFTINSIDVTGATTYDVPVITNGEGDATSTFNVNDVTANTEDYTVTYTINLSPKEGFLGGNDVPVFNTEGEYPTGLRITRSNITADTADDIGDLEPKDSSDYANVAIADYEFGLVTHDKTIIKGESVNVSELYDDVTHLPSDWTAEYVQLNVSVEGEEGANVAPVIPTEYTLLAQLAPKKACEYAVVAQPAQSVKATAVANVDVEYKVNYALTNISASNNNNAKYLAEYVTVLSGNGYALPDEITVAMGEKELISGMDYSYDSNTGYIVINANVVSDHLTITAEATEATYTITYIPLDKDNEQIIAEIWTENYTNNATINHTKADAYAEKMNAAAAAGYEYVWDWSTEDGSRLNTMPAHDITVFGYYDKITYTLTINYVNEAGNTVADSFTADVKWDTDYTVTSPEVSEYTPDMPVVTGTMPMADTNIIVTYKQNVYALIINYVDESGKVLSQPYSTSLPAGNAYRVVSPEISGYITDIETVEGTMPAEAVTVTVPYREDVTSVAVTFDPNGGALGAGENTKTVLCGNNHIYGELPTPVLENNKFLGWYTEKDGGSLVAASTVVENDTDHILYAHWEQISSAVTYDANGGTFSDGTASKTTNTTDYGEPYPTVGEPTRTGYTFLGWYRDTEAKDVFDTDTTFTIQSPTKLYAGWKANDSATVNFKVNDATVKTYPFEPGTTLVAEKITPPTAGGYFKGWYDEDDVAETLVLDYYKKKNGNNSFTVKDNTDETSPFARNYIAAWYDASSLGNAYVSDAKAQAVTLASGKKAIRFLALIDNGYNTYKKAGFVISTECPTPTIESGYQYSSQRTIYEKIYAMKADGTAGWLDIAYLSENTFSFSNGAGLLYTNLVIKDGNEDKIYYATPYIINASGEYVYGETRAISYNQLKEYDASANSN